MRVYSKDQVDLALALLVYKLKGPTTKHRGRYTVYRVSMSKVNIYMPYMYNKSNTAKKTDYKLLPALQRLPISILIIDN